MLFSILCCDGLYLGKCYLYRIKQYTELDHMTKNSSLLVFLLVFASAVSAQGSFFKTRDFGRYLLADHYAPFMKVNTGIGLNFADYNIASDRKQRFVFYNETTVGGEIPLYYYKSPDSKHSLSVSIPISFSVWFDFTENITAPILNTDYRFAPLEFNYSRDFESEHFKNLTLKFIPFFHESTHIGDELTIARMNDSLAVTRVNVSYETFNLSLLLNDPKDMITKNHSFKLGARFLINPDKGWYSISSFDGDTSLFSISPDYEEEGRVSTKYSLESFFQYQYQNPETKLAFKNTMFTVSLDQSLRVKYGYAFELPEDLGNDKLIRSISSEEELVYSGNLLVGWQFLNTEKKRSGLGVYLRAYMGLNYHGQFRNIPIYKFYGCSIIYAK